MATDADREARFVAFVAEHRDRAVGLAWRLLSGDGAAAEDVAQEAFVRAYRALGGFREESRLSHVYRILVNEVQRHRRWLPGQTNPLGRTTSRSSGGLRDVRPRAARADRVRARPLPRGQRRLRAGHLEGSRARGRTR